MPTCPYHPCSSCRLGTGPSPCLFGLFGLMGQRSRSDRLSRSGSSIGDLGRRVGVALRAGLLYNPRSPFAPLLCIARSLVSFRCPSFTSCGLLICTITCHPHTTPSRFFLMVPLVRELLAGPPLYCYHYHTQRELSKGAPRDLHLVGH